MTRAVIALGSNLGDRLANLRAAVAMLESNGLKVFEKSEVWETSPVPADQPPYYNAALAGETDLDPLELLAECKRIEHSLGRRPGKRWGPRPIDLDVLFYGDGAFESQTLTIPHPRVAERVFVLAPLADIDDDPLPVLGRTAAELLELLGTEGAWPTGERL